jgi:hypothetical protein
MKALGQNRVVIILLALGGILALGVLASGIRDMKFREPDPFYIEWPTGANQAFTQVVQQMEALPIEKVILFWTVVLVFTAVVIMLINPKYRWKILKAVLRAALIFIALVWALKALAQSVSSKMTQPGGLFQNGINNQNQNTLPVYSPPAEVPWISYLVSLGILSGLVLAGWWLWNLNKKPLTGVRQNIADIARETLDQIAEGDDFGDAVSSCYFRMTEAVRNVRGLERQDDMTPAEFAYRMESVGLPGEPVHRLTRLFESVRYGAKKPGEQETREAVVCLNEIITACGAGS